MKEYNFTARLLAGEGNGVYVAFPYNVKKEFGKSRVPYKCTIDGEPYRGTLVKYGTPHHIILVLKAIREKINKAAGDEVDIWLTEDKEERKIDIPAALTKVLKQHGLEAAFSKLSYTHQKEYVNWVNQAKQEETRTRRIAKIPGMLKQKKAK
ncbi:MAG TPA: YdeI/OmpD-associated family protein [Chitinophagales bacterium]|nr:YdeI/OmpD-associated family protein [Chitinophagales bacterium]